MPHFLVLLSVFLPACAKINTSLKEAFRAEDPLILDVLPEELRSTVWSQLPKEGYLQIHDWQGAYFWPMSRGGINAKLFGELYSPLEKFALVFGDTLETTDMDPDAAERRRERGLVATYMQSIHDEESISWAGHCEGSALAAQWFKISYPVQLHASNGEVVNFYPHEIRALAANWLKGYVSPGDSFKFSGTRVLPQTQTSSKNGRPISREVRDVNAGLFMVAIANFIGRAHTSLIADISPGIEVLNFPLVGYHVVDQHALSDEQSRLWREFNPNAAHFVEVRLSVTYLDNHRMIIESAKAPPTFEKEYNMIIELDIMGQIVGGEWMNDSQMDHPDLIYHESLDESALTATAMNGFAVAGNMQKLINASQNATISVPPKGIADFLSHKDVHLGYQELLEFPIVPAD